MRFDVTTAMGVKVDRAEGLADELAYALGVTSTRVGDLAITYSESAGSEAERLLMPWRRLA